jgi:hypothetical protein
MNWKIISAIVLAALMAALVSFLYFRKTGPRPSVVVTLRIGVIPREQAAFVLGQANSARFKYELGKKAGVKPVLAQQLSVKPVPNLPLFDVRVGVETWEEAQLCTDLFVKTLQAQCGSQAKLTLVQQNIR